MNPACHTAPVTADASKYGSSKLFGMVLGAVLVLVGLAEVGAGFAMKLHRLHRGGGLVVGAVLTVIAGALLMAGHASPRVAVVVAILGQALAVASYLHLRRSAR